ncbi:MAG: hypothetical protein ACHQ50_00905 [Fimbriimonadales bacterium]
MFTLLFYAGVCAVIAGVLTVVSTVFRPIHKKGDSKPWYAMLTFFVIVFSIPYAYTEGLTGLYGNNMKAAIEDAYGGSDIQGPMHYFRIIGYRPDKEATALVIGSERESWGGTDRPILSVHLVKEGDKWTADTYEIVACDRLNKDGYAFPPYW